MVPPEDQNVESNSRELKMKETSYEPILYNINLLSVFSKILNDVTIRDKKEFSHVIQFSASILRHFGNAARDNHMLFVETLFRFPHPHRVCEMVTNHYVTEELVMIGEREMLLERAREEEEENWGERKTDGDSNSDDDEGNIEEKKNNDIHQGEHVKKNQDANPNRKIVDEINTHEDDKLRVPHAEKDVHDYASISDYVINKESNFEFRNDDNSKENNGSEKGNGRVFSKNNKLKRIKRINKGSLDDSDDDEDFGTQNSHSNPSQLVFDDDE